MHKLTSKRQVTIPKSVCNTLGLEPGDFVEVFARDGVAHLVRMNNSSLAGKFSGLTSNRTMPSSPTIKRALKSRAAKKFRGLDDRG